ncbi:hypothetical protein ACILDS_09115 [Capnocytophaga canis]|uniref:GTP-binding protein n=1 Tax=Capnocytophaga canis TaxID=1848903 RepID=A0A0B7I4X1_9FLAO|nr:hypothetical protein [Capnocytophaga canis]CEN46675.1 conserved hypothetical protein [Capnocytophaga canis]
MKNLNKSIPLRPRFIVESEKPVDELLHRVRECKEIFKEKYLLVISDRQVWIHIYKNQRKYYSPHLQVEFQPKEEGGTRIRALFGPEPTLWSFFMFLHFAIATTFVIFLVLAYSHHILKDSFSFDLIMMALMVALWFFLYIFARISRTKGVPQMYELREVLDDFLE